MPTYGRALRSCRTITSIPAMAPATSTLSTVAPSTSGMNQASAVPPGGKKRPTATPMTPTVDASTTVRCAPSSATTLRGSRRSPRRIQSPIKRPVIEYRTGRLRYRPQTSHDQERKLIHAEGGFLIGWVTGPYAVRKVAIQRRALACMPASRLRNDRRSNLEVLGFVAEAAVTPWLLVFG